MAMLHVDRLRATLRGEHTEVRMLLIHPMTSGRSVNNDLTEQSLHFIQDIRCWRNNEEVLAVKCGPATAENPYFSFRLSGGNKDDLIKVRWVDNIGEKGTISALVR